MLQMKTLNLTITRLPPSPPSLSLLLLPATLILSPSPFTLLRSLFFTLYPSLSCILSPLSSPKIIHGHCQVSSTKIHGLCQVSSPKIHGLCQVSSPEIHHDSRRSRSRLSFTARDAGFVVRSGSKLGPLSVVTVVVRSCGSKCFCFLYRPLSLFRSL